MSWVLGAIFPKGNSREHAPSDPLLKTVSLAVVSFLLGCQESQTPKKLKCISRTVPSK